MEQSALFIAPPWCPFFLESALTGFFHNEACHKKTFSSISTVKDISQCLFEKFKIKYPEIKIGHSKFCELGTQWCILTGGAGTHTVSVCSIHQNVKLMNGSFRVSSAAQIAHFAPKCITCALLRRNDVFPSNCTELAPKCLLQTIDYQC